MKGKLSPGSVKKLALPKCIGGINKAELAREVIAVNFYIQLFIRNCKDKLKNFTNANKNPKRKSKKNVTTLSGKRKKLEEIWTQELCGSSCFSKSNIEIPPEIPDHTNPLIAGEDFVSVGAAFSVIKQDEELANLVLEEYVLYSEETTKLLDQLKQFLRLNRGVEKSKKKRDAKSTHASSDERDGASSDEGDGSSSSSP